MYIYIYIHVYIYIYTHPKRLADEAGRVGGGDAAAVLYPFEVAGYNIL